ncbi:hypothetical protein KO505_06960 [Psychrosphaera sp. F3M07]|uniref:hypothetical protein n=1 Tax=Psychrosphaera sp. F3M07 TaxID=2841560 RepID=UPI001C0A1ECD|nr:hypothetical protein [Psychrosphaera sp. F3M07]MBU2917700.1 hypothetical protein [Psychrosphaera sp. F3M07]
MNISDIINICQVLKNEGKEPSIALIKARADKNTPMPTLISGLQQWRSNPDVVIPKKQNKLTSTDEKKTLEQRVEMLEQEVALLKSLLLK